MMKTGIERWNAVAKSMRGCAMKVSTVALAGCLAMGLAGCSGGTAASSSSSSAESSSSSVVEEESESSTVYATTVDETPYDLEYSKRDQDPSYDESSATKISLSGSSASVSGDGASADGSTVNITSEGVYVLTGSYEGQVQVDAPEDAKVQLVLDDADISNTSGSSIYIAQADKCFITLADGSSNSVADGSSTYTFSGSETEPDATIFANCDLTFQGEGSLGITSLYNDAVKTKDDLVITGGDYTIGTKGDALVGKDSVKIADGTFDIRTEEGDGIKSSKKTSESKGFVSIDGGDFAIDAGDKGIKAWTYLRVADGTIDITSADDALHSDGSLRLAGGDISISAGDDAVHTEYELAVEDGTVDIAKCYEGYEGQVINISGGDTHIVASDDGINASSPDGDTDTGEMSFQGFAEGEAPEMPDGEAPEGDAPEPPSGEQGGQAPSASGFGTDSGSGSGSAAAASGSSSSGNQQQGQGQGQGGFGGRGQGGPNGQGGQGGFGGRGGTGNQSDMPGGQMGFGGMGGGMMMDTDESCELNISGGTLFIEAEGDGLDSNGYMTITGGEVYVSGPTNAGNGALDTGLGASANGGTVIAVGAVGMAESFSDGTQPFGYVAISGSANQELTVTDESGTVIASFTPTKAYQCAVITCPDFVEGGTYTVSAGSTTATLTASTTATADGNTMGMGGGQGGGRQGF